jgi:hypothetical protein
VRERLSDGDTLAEIAEDEGKSVAGLVDAMVDAAAAELDEAVDEGGLTRERADDLERMLEELITGLVKGEPLERGFFGPRFGFGSRQPSLPRP